MKKNIFKILVAALVAMFFWMMPSVGAFAEEGETTISGMSISLTPTSKVFQIASSSVYDQSFTVNNDGSEPMRIEVYAAPYSYVYSDEEDLYKLGFNNENNFTQITRWITFKNTAGEYVDKALFSIEPKASLDIDFRITTPESIPSGGQYAVIFAHTLSSAASGSGIRTEASPGMVVYGRSSEGETVISAEITDLNVEQKNLNNKDSIIASAKVKNTGNVDFNVISSFRVSPIIGFSSYETPENLGRTSIIPDAELIITDVWEDAPGLGIFKATWTVTVGDNTETYESVIFRISPLFIIIFIIVLTIIIISVIMVFRKRKERRARLAV